MMWAMRAVHPTIPLALLLAGGLAVLGAGEPLRTEVPLELAHADRTYTEIFARCSPAVVGLFCRGTFAAQESGFYGTGAVVTGDGLILTSTTVVPKDGREIKVYFTSGHVRPASIAAIDPGSESVLLRLDEKIADLPHMPLARSADCRVGDPVYSWGNPHLTIQRDGNVSLSVGAISGLYDTASVDDQSRYVGPVIEVDAAVNPGSDGGPITDQHGRLIGVMSLAFSPTRWLGLAIPADRIRAGIPTLAQIPPTAAAKAGPAERLVWAMATDLQAAAAKAAPAVVGVYTVRQGDREEAPERRDRTTLALRAPYPPAQRAALERLQGPVGAASGFLVDPAGIVVTAAFNVGDATFPKIERDAQGRAKQTMVARKVERIFVYTADGTRYAARVLGRDAKHDLAVLELQETGATRFPCLDLTAGTPLAQGGAVAVLGRSEPPGTLLLNGGTLSAVDRVKGLAFQLSAMINYGNLGGPVIDRQGRLVGMASHINHGTVWRQNCGVGFCLRATHLATAVPILRRGGKLPAVKEPSLGVVIDPDADDAGARVRSVVEGGPAATAGLQPGDLIVAVDGEEVSDFVTFKNLILQNRAGTTVTLVIERAGARQTLTAVIGEE
jgi:S1-C subfamily serine protease